MRPLDGLNIPPLLSGGLNLGYRCSSKCRHCLYACGPHRRDGEGDSPNALDEILDMLVERAPGALYHIGGGEPFLDVVRLRRCVALMMQRRLTLEYVETNAFWAKSPEIAEQVLGELAEAGLVRGDGDVWQRAVVSPRRAPA